MPIMTSEMKRSLGLRARRGLVGAWWSASSAAVTLACAANPDPTNVFDSMGTTTGNPITTAEGDDSSTAAMVDGTAASSESGVDGTGPDIKLDVGSPEDTETRQDYCNFVDLLFVIDNSLSMEEYQLQLALAWPTFVDAMWENLPPGTDLHVGMTTTSFYTGSCSEFEFNCESQASQSEIDEHYITPDQGSTGTNGEQGRLFEWDGRTFYEAIVGEDPADFKNWFSQAAVAAGETGCSFEMMSAAAGYAFHPANATANEGFLRDEGAVLVVVILTDEPDKSPEGPQAYYDMIMQAKAGCGGDNCVIVTGLVDTCIIDVNNELWQFFNLFGGFQPNGDLEDPTQYADVIGSALAQVIGETCETIPPAG
jgi:hypothetical protein